MAINLNGRVVTQAKVKDCRGKGCPVYYCKKKKPESDNKCLGYYDMVDCIGGKYKLWRCEYVKP
jgi:hypothetical protein